MTIKQHNFTWIKNLSTKWYVFAILFADLFLIPVIHLLTAGEFSKDKVIEYNQNGWHHFFALLIYMLIHFLYNQKEVKFRKENEQALTELKKLDNLPTPLREYAKLLKRNSIRNINNSIGTLLTSGLTDQDLNQKIQILQSLLRDCKFKNITRFWATSFDLPSSLYDKFDSFFETQKECLRLTSDKRRVVILNKDQLNDEITQNSEKLRKFIEWHTNNNFELKFLLNYNKSFENKTQSIVKTGIKNKNVLTDFAIIGKSWIYGESTLLLGKSTDAINAIEKLTNLSNETKQDIENAINEVNSEDLNIRTLKLYSNDDSNFEIWKEYETLYDNLWNKWDQNQWPLMSKEQALSEIERHENLVNTKSERLDYYGSKYPSLKSLTGKDFSNELINLIAGLSSKTILATDLTSLKSEMEYEKWMTPLFKSWMSQNIELVTNCNCNITRVYVLNRKISNRTQANEIYNIVFKPQIDAGIAVLFVNANDLIVEKIKFHDFVLVEDEFCVSTRWYEDFETPTYSIENNFDKIDHLIFYSNIFTEICSKAIKINELEQHSVVRYLMDLKY